MAKNIKYQFKYAIEQSFKAGADKHSMKRNEAENGNRGTTTFSYSDRKNLIDVSANFSNWMKDRIAQYDFVEGVDFIKTQDLSSPNMANAKSRAQTRIEYH